MSAQKILTDKLLHIGFKHLCSKCIGTITQIWLTDEYELKKYFEKIKFSDENKSPMFQSAPTNIPTEAVSEVKQPESAPATTKPVPKVKKERVKSEAALERERKKAEKDMMMKQYQYYVRLPSDKDNYKARVKIYNPTKKRDEFVYFGNKEQVDYITTNDELIKNRYLNRTSKMKKKDGRMSKDDITSNVYWSRRLLYASGEEIHRPMPEVQ
jgi:hypothetical protein